MTNPPDARAAILQSIAGVNPKPTGAEISAAYAGLSRNYRRAGSLDSTARLQMIEHRLLEYDAGVSYTAPEALSSSIARLLAARGKPHMAIPPGLPSSWLPREFAFVMAETLTAVELDRMDGLLSGCSVAIANTGTLVLQNAAAQGARKLSLVPDYLLCVVFGAQVVETVPEAFERLAATSALATTFISGPSATADIEMTRIKGVHGPRFLDVLLVV